MKPDQTLSLPAPPAAPDAEDGEASGLLARFRAIVVGDAIANVAVVLAIAVGFFHGWLKLRFRSPVTTFAFDVFLLLALAIVLVRSGTLTRFFPPGRTSQSLIAFYVLCAAYLPLSLISGMPPFLVALSTLRGWVFATLLYGLGYQIVRSRPQVHGYYLLILLLGVVTAIYGIGQSDSEVLQMMEQDEYFARRYRGQGYVDAEGGFHVRRFSSFISSGAFGGTMATTIIFATAIFLAPGTGKLERALIALALVPIGYGMLLSGARSATIAALLGVLILLCYRRQWISTMALGVVGAAGAILASMASGGGVFDRLATLNLSSLFFRFWLPTQLGFEYMLGHPLGGGLGKTGFRPGFLVGVGEYDDYLAPDGDLGRLMVEFGVLGVLIFGRVAYHAARRMYAIVKGTLRTPSAALVLAAAVNCWISIAFLGVGSPFVGIPLGVLVWFFAGAAERLHELEQGGAAALPSDRARAAGERRESPPGSALAPVTLGGGRAFLFARRETDRSRPPGPGAKGASEVPVAPVTGDLPADSHRPAEPRRGKVFLYGAPPGGAPPPDRSGKRAGLPGRNRRVEYRGANHGVNTP